MDINDLSDVPGGVETYRGIAVDDGGEVGTVYVTHGQIQHVLCVAGIVDRDDVGMVEAGGGSSLAFKATSIISVGG